MARTVGVWIAPRLTNSQVLLVLPHPWSIGRGQMLSGFVSLAGTLSTRALEVPEPLSLLVLGAMMLGLSFVLRSRSRPSTVHVAQTESRGGETLGRSVAAA